MKSFIVEPGNIPENVKVYGLMPDFNRMPLDVAKTVSDSVYEICQSPTGGRIKFKTDSRKIRLQVELQYSNLNSGSDVWSDGIYCGKIVPPSEECTSYGGELEIKANPNSGKMRTVTIFMPRTAPVKRITVSLDEGSAVEAAEPYNIEKPIVYYGSSITMGAPSTSPSKAYTALVSEMMGANHINLGFGGSAKGEREMACYIASLEMSAFVMDYEHNADTIEDLKKTHKPFFDIIRAAHPTLPILLISRPDTDREFVRSCMGRRVVMDTFHAALDAGDRYVDYIDGFYLWGNYDRESCTSDGCHPSEMGFERMANVVYPRLKALVERNGRLPEDPPELEHLNL